MNYTYLKVFYTVAKHENISKAATELGVTQPAVSRIINSIEKEYNTKLFLRSKNGVSLTREGLNLFEMIKIPFIELEKIDDSISSTSSFKETIVHIGATATALYCYLFKYLEEIKKQFPFVKFRIYSDSSARLLEKVKKGEIDFAFITTPFKGGDDVEIDNIYKLNNILIAPISYKDKLSGPVSIKSLVNYPFILLSKEMQFRQYVNDYLSQYGIRIVPEYETDSSSLLIPLVENDCGITFIPEEMANKTIEEGKCFKVDLIEEVPLRYVSFAMSKEKTHSNVVYDIKKAIVSGFNR